MRVYNNELLKEIEAERDHGICAAKPKPDRKRILSIIKRIQLVLLPDFYRFQDYTQETAMATLIGDLTYEIALSRDLDGLDPACAEELTEEFLSRLPKVMHLICTDIQAIYDGDPAAKSKAEVILCYPGFYAISIYRIAHELYDLKVPYIPRITAVLGHHVKLYQGVTIGAKSFDLDENGLPVKGGKRHPDLGDHVIVYANATILGGTTVIGDHSIIGGNVWILNSVPPHTTVVYQNYDQKENA